MNMLQKEKLMRDLLDKLQIINENKVLNEEPPRGRQDGPGTRQGTNPAANAARILEPIN